MTIGDKFGTYYGEWSEKNQLAVPDGRGVLDCTDELILGYVVKGKWGVGSNRMVVYRNVPIFGSHILEKSRDGTLLEEGYLFDKQGLKAEGLFKGLV